MFVNLFLSCSYHRNIGWPKSGILSAWCLGFSYPFKYLFCTNQKKRNNMHCHCYNLLLYTLTSIWVLHTPNVGQNMFFHRFILIINSTICFLMAHIPFFLFSFFFSAFFGAQKMLKEPLEDAAPKHWWKHTTYLVP